MTEALKPCPFCGSEARFEIYGGTACAVVCESCHCGTMTVCLDDGMQAVKAWNRRCGEPERSANVRDVRRTFAYGNDREDATGEDCDGDQ